MVRSGAPDLSISQLPSLGFTIENPFSGSKKSLRWINAELLVNKVAELLIARKTITRFLWVLAIPPLLSAAADDRAYQKALEGVLKEYPPGDYNERPVRRFSANRSAHTDDRQFSLEHQLLEPVDRSDKDIQTLFSEAASFFLDGRWDLALKRYKQSVLLDPENSEAKARALDLLILMCMYQAESWEEAAVKRKEFEMRVSKDIVPKPDIR